MQERVEAARRHLSMSIDWKGEKLAVYETRRHYTNYFKGIPNFKPLRMSLVSAETSGDVFETLEKAGKEFADFDFSTI
jgi:tRNA-dihydrouridine synthase B